MIGWSPNACHDHYCCRMDTQHNTTRPTALTVSTLIMLFILMTSQVPKGWLELVVSACGGVVGWEGEGSPFSSSDPGITHQVTQLVLSFQDVINLRVDVMVSSI